MKVLSGKQFNETYPNIEFYKVINTNLNYGDYVYINGLNEVKKPEGLQFTSLDNIRYLLFGDQIICSVKIPDDALVYINKIHLYDIILFRADKLILDLDNKLPSTEFVIVPENNLLASLDFSNKMRLKKISSTLREKLIFFNRYILKKNFIFYSGLFMIGALTKQYFSNKMTL